MALNSRIIIAALCGEIKSWHMCDGAGKQLVLERRAQVGSTALLAILFCYSMQRCLGFVLLLIAPLERLPTCVPSCQEQEALTT
jgi:hypothetical protein